MRRADFLRLTGLKADFFGSLLRQGLIPQPRAAREKTGGWGDYSAASVFFTRLALDLARTAPTQFEASRFVQAELGLMRERAASLADLQKTEIWFGFVRVGSTEIEPETQQRAIGILKWPLCGTFREITAEIGRIDRKKVGDVYDCVLVNASQQYRTMVELAGDAGLADRLRAEVEVGLGAWQ